MAAPNSGEERLKTKLVWAGPLLVTLLATILMLVSNTAPWTNSGRLYTFVTSQRATVQIVVQILSQSFGALHVYALCSLINFGIRLRLARIPHSIDHLQFWSDVTLQRLDWALPLHLMVILVLFNAAIIIPGAIWAGALTPVITLAHSASVSQLEVPQYSSASSNIWGKLTWLEQEPSVHTSQGIFSYSPNYDFSPLILTQAASASTIGNASQPISKLDNTRYSYVGRSHGVGSSVGLVDESFVQNATKGFTYQENGYLTNVQCIVNSSSDWLIYSSGYQVPNGQPNLYWIKGHLANGNPEQVVACGLGSTGSIFSLVGSVGLNGTANIFSFATGTVYAPFDKIQCAVDFTPAQFSVSVNTTERLISVALVESGPDVRDIDPTGQMKAITMRMPTSFSQQHSCDLYTSLIGNTFKQNSQSLTNGTSSSSSANTITTEQALRGTQDSLTSILDNSLLA